MLLWVGEMAKLCQTDFNYWGNGSEAEYNQITNELVRKVYLKIK